MDRNSVDWHGSLPAMTTPFDLEGRIDETSFCRNVDRLLAGGATGLIGDPSGRSAERTMLDR